MNLDNICKEVIEVAKNAGHFFIEERKKFDSNAIEYKGKNDLVSYVDKKTEEFLVSELSKILPQASFITEEGTVAQNRSDLFWLIDPLDGTTNFIHNVPMYCTSIALVQNMKVVLGVIYDPNKDECFHAVLGGGAYCNENKISVSTNKTLSTSLFATGFPYTTFDKIQNYLNIVHDLMLESHGLRRTGSAAIDMAWVACGRFDGYFEYNIKPYDIAAGSIILQEAGGKVTDFAGTDDFLFAYQIVAAGKNHDELLKIVDKNWNK